MLITIHGKWFNWLRRMTVQITDEQSSATSSCTLSEELCGSRVASPSGLLLRSVSKMVLFVKVQSNEWICLKGLMVILNHSKVMEDSVYSMHRNISMSTLSLSVFTLMQVWISSVNTLITHFYTFVPLVKYDMYKCCDEPDGLSSVHSGIIVHNNHSILCRQKIVHYVPLLYLHLINPTQ